MNILEIEEGEKNRISNGSSEQSHLWEPSPAGVSPGPNDAALLAFITVLIVDVGAELDWVRF